MARASKSRRSENTTSSAAQPVSLEREAADDIVGILGRYDSPRVALEKKVREHQERATFLTFVRDHVNPEDLYRLDSADLRMSEILPDKPW